MDKISQAFSNIHREHFVPQRLRHLSHIDSPLPIGYGQTISQPTTVQSMLHWLDPQIGDNILDIGSGSGWTSALLSNIVGQKGKVFAVERIPELMQFGRNNCENIGIKNVKFFQANRGYGLPRFAPYDRILVSASARRFPVKLLDQLKINGKLVIPINNDIHEVTKTSVDKYLSVIHHGYEFVPLL